MIFKLIKGCGYELEALAFHQKQQSGWHYGQEFLRKWVAFFKRIFEGGSGWHFLEEFLRVEVGN